MNFFVHELNESVVSQLEELGTSDVEGGFVFVREDGVSEFMSFIDVADEIDKDDVNIQDVYAKVTGIIESHNEHKTKKCIGVVHVLHVGETEDDPHLLVVALDDAGESILTMFPVEKDGWLGEAKKGTGFSPHFDPWGKQAKRQIEA